MSLAKLTSVSSITFMTQDYFAYAMIWQLQGQRFLMLLGTASMVKAVNILVTKYHGGLSDVIIVFPKQSPIEVGSQMCTSHMQPHERWSDALCMGSTSHAWPHERHQMCHTCCQWLLTDISHTHTSPLPLLKWTSGSTYWRQAGEVW
ncbi:hypothetical protein V8E53_001879 [Lactarius tabidus]